jgi:hypothetical protein
MATHNTMPATRLQGAAARPITAVAEAAGYPSADAIPPTNLSLYQVCQRYPNSIRGTTLDAFVQWNWSGTDIFDCVPQNIQQTLLGRHAHVSNAPNVFTKRIKKRRDTLKKEGDYARLMHAPKLRQQGHPNTAFRGNARYDIPPAPTASASTSAVPAPAPTHPQTVAVHIATVPNPSSLNATAAPFVPAHASRHQPSGHGWHEMTSPTQWPEPQQSDWPWLQLAYAAQGQPVYFTEDGYVDWDPRRILQGAGFYR